MSDLLGTGIAVTDLTASGIAGICVLLIIFGRLIPSRRADAEAAALREDRDRAWALLDKLAESNRDLAEQVRLLTPAAQLATHIAQELHSAQDASRGVQP